jgi:hypothetical protein
MRHTPIITPVPCSPVRAGANSAGENQFTALVDREGYVCGGSVTREKSTDFLSCLRALPRYALPEIVMPAGWPTDADGRGYTVLEYERGEHLRTLTEKAA